MAEAQKIAQEIEGVEADGNIHVAEERGQYVDRKGLDDEDLYSGVLRTGEDVAKATGVASTAKTVISTTAKGETSDSDGGAKKKSTFKMNPNAASFNFNPKAKPFVPGGGGLRRRTLQRCRRKLCSMVLGRSMGCNMCRISRPEWALHPICFFRGDPWALVEEPTWGRRMVALRWDMVDRHI